MTKRILAAIMAFVMIFSCMPAMHASAEEVAPASGTTYYVSSLNGAEGNDGTSESAPFASLLKINEITLQPGDRVLLERGSVFVDEYLHIQGSGSADAPIIIDAYGDESLPKPLIQTNGYGVWYQDYGKRLDNINHKYRGNVSTCILLYDVEYIEISNIAMTNEGNYAAGEVYNSKSRIDRTGVAGIAENIGTVDHVYLRDLDIRNVEGNVRNKHMANGGIYFLCHQPDSSATGIAKFDDVLIEGCRLDKVNRWGIAVGYTAYWDQFAYGSSINADVCRTYGSTNVVIRGNYLTEIGGDGITTMYCYQPLMEYNVLDGYCRDMTDEIYGPSDGGLVAAGIWPWMCKTAILQYNEAYDSTPNPDGQAWDADWGDNAIYQYNYSSNNSGGAVMFCGTYACNTVFRYNISQNDLAGVLNLASSPNGEIYNNVFYIKEGVKINRSGMSGGKGNTISNNIFYYAGSEPADATLGNWGDITADWNANLYYNYETTPDDAYAITADPLFVDPGKGPSGAQASGLVHELSAFEGYKLQSVSPAINAGVPIQDNGGKDFFGNSLDLIPDIGAHEAGTFAADASSAVLVDLELGETVTITDTTGDYSDSTPVMDNEKIASVAMSGKGAVTQTTVSSTPASELVDGASYLICNAKTGSAVTNVQVDASAWSTRALQLTGNKTASAANTWTLEANGTGYKIKDSNGDYLHIELNASSLGDGDTFTAEAYGWNSWTFLNAKGFYLDNLGSQDFLGGWTEIGVASTWELYEITTSTLEGATELTFTGLFPGTTNIIIGDTLYQVRVAGDVEEVKLEVGESATFTDETGNYVGADTSALDKNVATVELTSTATEAYTLGSKVTTMADGKYILVNTRAGKPVTNQPASTSNAKGLLFSGAKEDAANAAVWTITALDGGGYAIQDLQGKYLTVGADSAGITTAAHALDVAYNGSAWTISENNAYLNQHGGSSSTCAAGWENYAASYDAGSMWEIYQANPITAENGTQIIFTAVGGGETYVQIGQIIYHITVSGDALCLHANTELRDAVAATCTTEGYTGDTWCLDCGIKLSTGTAIPVTDHNYENGVCVGCGKTLSDIYQIATAEDLYQFRAYVAEGNLDADAVVTADITITADSGLGKWTGIGSSSKKYTGTFDGQGHTIRGLNGRGLFANVGVGGVVKNVTVADSTITGNGVGAIAGQNFGGTIDNCTVTASTIEGTKGHVGGIVGTNYGTVTRCTNDGCAVYNDECSSVGGIVGYNNNNGSDPAARNPIVSYCVNTGSVTTDYDSSERPAGGIVGENEGGLVTNCYNTGAVVSDGDAVGGIVGYANQGTIEFCHSVGSAEGDAYVGAIVGKAIHPTTVRSCYYLADAESDDQDGTTAMTAAQFASGQVTWLLNGATDQGELVWKQTLNTDAYPVFAGAVVSYDSEQDLYYNQQGGEEPDVPVENPFVDVPADSYCFEPVLWAVEKGITTGTSEKHFSPERICTRAEVVTFLWRAAGSPEPKSTVNPFVDVNESDYFYKPVLWAVENGVTNGVDDNHFNPAGTCLRAEVVTFLWRAKGSPASSTEITFTDVPAESFYANAVAWALEKGVTNGTSATTFGAAEACTRAQVVTFLYRAYK